MDDKKIQEMMTAFCSQFGLDSCISTHANPAIRMDAYKFWLLWRAVLALEKLASKGDKK